MPRSTSPFIPSSLALTFTPLPVLRMDFRVSGRSYLPMRSLSLTTSWHLFTLLSPRSELCGVLCRPPDTEVRPCAHQQQLLLG